MKKILLTLALALNLSMVYSASAHAYETAKSKVNSGNIVSDSKFIFSKQTAADIRWAMIKVSKDGISEQILTAVEKSRISMNIYLRNGAGIYDIQIYETSAVEQFSGGYYGTQNLKIENTDSRDMAFLLPSNLVQSDNAEIIALAKTITAEATNELDALRKIHLYVATNVKYDYDSYYDGSYAKKPYDAVGMMIRLKGVCSGYANLYAALTRAVGIRTKVVQGLGYLNDGQTGDHAWNEVFINGEWKSIDVTWDSTTGRMFKYFMIAQELFEKDHQKQQEMLEN